MWARGAVGSASDWQSEGQGFESPRVHQIPNTNRLLTARSMSAHGRASVRAGSSVVAGRGHGETSRRRIDLLAAVADRDGEVLGLAGGHLFRLLVLELADLDSLRVVERVNERQVVAIVVGTIVELAAAGSVHLGVGRPIVGRPA